MFTATKTFHDFPCCHRAWRHEGACKYLHGYCRSFRLVFEAPTLNDIGFVTDLSALKDVEAELRRLFDHTVLVARDDPALPTFKALEALGVMRLTELPATTSEAIAKYVHDLIAENFFFKDPSAVKVRSVTVVENEKIAATYEV